MHAINYNKLRDEAGRHVSQADPAAKRNNPSRTDTFGVTNARCILAIVAGGHKNFTGFA
jgi:hypothetical protein